MDNTNSHQLSELVDVNNSTSVLKEVESIYSQHYEPSHFSPVKECFNQVKKLFNGEFKGYKACNTQYHDLNHTLTAFLTAARIVDGYNLSEEKLQEKYVILVLQAALLHDVGYIQDNNDNQGTGAKYTLIHIERGIQFIDKYFQPYSINSESIPLIERMIKCTSLNIDFKNISFESEEEKTIGSIMGTADLIGQIADRVYLEKLIFLYYEFKEAGIFGYNTEFDIIKKTLKFYMVMRDRLITTLGGLYHYLRKHFCERYGIDKNLYIVTISHNIDYLEKIISDDSTNFRKKLKRMDLEKINSMSV